MLYHIYVYQAKMVDEIEEVFEMFNHDSLIERVEDTILKLTMDTFHEEIIDLDMIHASIVSDFGLDTSILLIEDHGFNFLPERTILSEIKHLKSKVYDIDDFLIYASKKHDLKQLLKRRLVDLLGQDYINTILMIAHQNMNLSIAARKLYLHRNSLNYRVEKISQKTSLDIKTFRGLRALVSIIEE